MGISANWTPEVIVSALDADVTPCPLHDDHVFADVNVTMTNGDGTSTTRAFCLNCLRITVDSRAALAERYALS